MSPVDMPYAGPTRTTHLVGQVLSLLSYCLAFLVSVGDMFAPSTTLQQLTPRGLVVATAIGLAVLSLVGLGAVVTCRWRIEWVAASAIAFLLLERSVPVWGRVFEGEFRFLSTASVITLCSTYVGHRALNLWTFSIRTRQSAGHAHELG